MGTGAAGAPVLFRHIGSLESPFSRALAGFRGSRAWEHGSMRMKSYLEREDGAVGWLVVGVLIGIFLVFYAVFALIF